MKCKECNKQKIKKINESKKKAIVRSYIRDWRKLLLIMVMSVSIFSVLAFISSMDVELLSTGFRISLLVIILVSWFLMFLMWAKIKPGLLSFAGLMFIVAPVLGFKEPVTSVIFFCLSASLFMLLIDVVLGVIFKVKVIPVERPWCPNREVHNIKKGSLK